MIVWHNGNKYTIVADGTIHCTNAWQQTSVIAKNWVGTNVVNQMIVNTLEELITGTKSLQGKK